MILTGLSIEAAVKDGSVIIDPFDPSRLNPNSYNFTLGKTLRVYPDRILDCSRENPTETIEMVDGEIVLEPRRLYLGHCCERIGSTEYVPTYAARSSVARLGLFINLSAPLGDIGFVGQWTIQLFALHPLRLREGMAIGQMMFWKPLGDIELYNGKYQGAVGPVASRIHRDMDARREPPDVKPARIGPEELQAANG